MDATADFGKKPSNFLAKQQKKVNDYAAFKSKMKPKTIASTRNSRDIN